MAMMEFSFVPKLQNIIYLIVDHSTADARLREDLLYAIQEYEAGLDEVEVKIHVLVYGQDVRWLTPEPVSPADFQWPAVEGSGISRLDAALDELEARLRISPPRGVPFLTPTILFVGTGWPVTNFIPNLRRLKNLPQYQRAIKAAISLDPDLDAILAALVNNPEAVIPPDFSFLVPRILDTAYYGYLVDADRPITDWDDDNIID